MAGKVVLATTGGGICGVRADCTETGWTMTALEFAVTWCEHGKCPSPYDDVTRAANYMAGLIIGLHEQLRLADELADALTADPALFHIASSAHLAYNAYRAARVGK